MPAPIKGYDMSTKTRRACVVWYNSTRDVYYGLRRFEYIDSAETAAARDSAAGIEFACACNVCSDAATVSVYQAGERVNADMLPVSRLEEIVALARRECCNEH
jgi:hypothetical protein